MVQNLDREKLEFVIDNIENKVRKIIPDANLSKIYVEPQRDNTVIALKVETLSFMFVQALFFLFSK